MPGWLRYLLIVCKYGLTIASLASTIYHRVETLARLRKSASKPMSSVDKAKAWDVRLIDAARSNYVTLPKDLDIVRLREQTWARYNQREKTMAKKSKSFWAKIAGAVVGLGLGAFLLSQGNVDKAMPLLSQALQTLVGIEEVDDSKPLHAIEPSQGEGLPL